MDSSRGSKPPTTSSSFVIANSLRRMGCGAGVAAPEARQSVRARACVRVRLRNDEGHIVVGASLGQRSPPHAISDFATCRRTEALLSVVFRG